MRRLIGIALAVLFACAPMAVQAASRIVVYPAQNPSSVQHNQEIRFQRLAFGTALRDFLGSNTSAAGVYSNLSVVPNGGMYVAVQPTQSNSLGSIYQIGVDDPLPVPAGTQNPQLASDSTKIVLLGLQSSPSGSLGPIVAPASGLQQYYLVEAQLQTVDASPLPMTFVNPNRTTTTQTVNTQRVDQIVYQLKAGTAASSPSVPTVDSGWVPIATVLVPASTSTITSGMIAAQPSFQGFVANGTNVAVAGLTLSGASAGCLQANSSGVVSSQPCTSGLGTVSGTAPIQATTSAGVATVQCPTCVTSVSGDGGNITSTGGTTPQVKMTASPTFSNLTASTSTTNGNATIPNAGTATASVNYGSQGAFQLQNSRWNGTSAVLNTWSIQSPNSGYLSFQLNGVTIHAYDLAGNDIVAPAGTATASQNYGSYGAYQLQDSVWNGSAAVSHTWQWNMLNTGALVAQYDAATKYTLDSSGNVTATQFNGSGAGLTGIPNSALTNSTISGVALGGSLATLTFGAHLSSSGTSYNGSTATTIQSDATNANTASTIVARDASGNFSAGTATLSGGVSAGSSTYGPTSATVNGMSITSSTITAAASSNLVFKSNNGGANSPVYVNYGAGAGYTGGLQVYDGGTTTFSTYGPTSATVKGLVTSTAGYGQFSYEFASGTSSGFTGIAAASAAVAQGVSASEFEVGNPGFSTQLAIDTSGNMGVAGNVTATNFFNGSRREWKKNITPYKFDALKLVSNDIEYAEYDCKTARCGPVGEHKVGIIANDSAYQVAGKKHDHYDAFAMAAIDGAAIRELNQHFEHLEHRVDGLESMVGRLCREKKNRKETACRAYHASGH